MKFVLILLFSFSSTWAAIPKSSPKISPLTEEQRLQRYEESFRVSSIHPSRLKAMTFSLKAKSVPTLIKVMKDANYPEKNRWHATMLLGQVMGKPSAAFIAKFADHPSWMMRVASLKALAALNMKEYKSVYIKSLKDPSLIVRIQTLDNITHMKLTELAPHVWNMMYDQSNYTGSTGQRKRTSIVRSIIRTIGELEYAPATKPLAKLIQKPKYQDLMEDLDHSLAKITGQKAPVKSLEAKRDFWKKTVQL
jgi:HEAT repeat protein